MAKAVHLINDEKFLPRFIERAASHFSSCAYIVFGATAPFKFLKEGNDVFVPSSWEAKGDQPIEDVYIHFMTYQKIKWVLKHAPKARVHWVYFGSDLYELLSTFHGFNLYSKQDRMGGFLSHIKGKTPRDRVLRYASLLVYHQHFKKFVKAHLTTFRFWNEGDYHLFKSAFSTSARFEFFQYGAYLQSDIDYVTDVLSPAQNEGPLQILVNHSGTRSGNHMAILKALGTSVEEMNLQLHAILSYGDKEHIERVSDFGASTFGEHWNGHMHFMPRLEYYKLLSKMNIAVFGHRRQEAGNSLFISMLLGTKIFIHNDSVLLPYLKQHGFHFSTLAEVGTPGWTRPLSEAQKLKNKEGALAYFDQKRIEQAYQNLAKKS